MGEKPHAVYMAKVTSALSCECGGRLERTSEGTYLCASPGCRWEGKKLAAVVMPFAAMYEKPEASA